MPGRAKSQALFSKSLGDPIFYLIPHSPEGLELLFLRSHSRSMVVKAFVNNLFCSGRPAGLLELCAADRAGLSGPVADHHRQVEYCILKLLGRFGALTGDINADFQHQLDSPMIDRGGLDNGAVSLISIAVHGPQEVLGHLRASGSCGSRERGLSSSPDLSYLKSSLS